MIIDIRKNRLPICLLLLVLGLTSALLLYNWSRGKTQQQGPKPDTTVCGDFLSWKEVKTVFPKYAEATVLDVDSRLSFRVQRRGGSSHADVQPLTAADTAVMKKIYNGQWVWKRKAVIVSLDNGRKIAASMNGMPHGQGAIKENNFDGHFCIHFRDSKTHGSKKVDLAHQMMIWKSANMLDLQLGSLEPEQIVQVFFTAVDQNEINIAGKLIDADKRPEALLNNLKSINNVKADNIKKAPENGFNVDLRVVFKDSKQELRKNLFIQTIKKSEGWKITPQSIIKLLDKNNQLSISIQSSGANNAEEEDLESDLNE